jgi:type II secretory pathway component GspD/PulD (secretin)
MRPCILERVVALTVMLLILAPQRLRAESKDQKETLAAAASQSQPQPQPETGPAQRPGTGLSKPPTPKGLSVRLFVVKNVQASTIAEIINEVYRDLLSANVKARVRKPKKQPFQGLSVGSDNNSNTILVTCSEGLMKSIEQMIKQLDQVPELPSP